MPSGVCCVGTSLKCPITFGVTAHRVHVSSARAEDSSCHDREIRYPKQGTGRESPDEGLVCTPGNGGWEFANCVSRTDTPPAWPLFHLIPVDRYTPPIQRLPMRHSRKPFPEHRIPGQENTDLVGAGQAFSGTTTETDAGRNTYPVRISAIGPGMTGDRENGCPSTEAAHSVRRRTDAWVNPFTEENTHMFYYALDTCPSFRSWFFSNTLVRGRRVLRICGWCNH